MPGLGSCLCRSSASCYRAHIQIWLLPTETCVCAVLTRLQMQHRHARSCSTLESNDRLCLKCTLDILILVLFVLDSRARGSVASESGSCQRQGTVGKRTQNWRYPTCGHGNIDCSVVVCDESTEVTRLMFVF